MKLSISNIAWDNDELESYLQIIKDMGCDGIEIAPSCIWDEPSHASDEQISKIIKTIKKYDLEVSSFHSLLYTKPNINIFNKEKRNETISYLKKIIEIAASFGTKTMIFGSPKNRQINLNNYDDEYNTSIELFKIMADKCKKYDICFCIEPLGTSCNNFIQTSTDGRKLVEAVDSPNFGLHLDASAITEMKEDLTKIFKNNIKILKHFHINDLKLNLLGTTSVDHVSISKAISNSGYNNFLSIEMKKHDNIKKAREVYFEK